MACADMSLQYIAPMCGRVVQASEPLRYAVVDGLVCAHSVGVRVSSPRPASQSPERLPLSVRA